MKLSFRSVLASLSCLLTLAFTGCDGGGGGDSAATGPSGAGSFSGSSISFNPTINFLAGNNLTYLNTETGSPFPAANPAINGAYTYVPNASFTAGTLTLTLDGVSSPVVLEISAFVRSGASVTGFTARANGQNYPVTVTGTLPAYQAPSGGGGGGAAETRADDTPVAMRGTHVLTFTKSDTPSITGVPANGTETSFTIGARTLSFGGRTLTDPVFYNGNAFEWIFKDGSIWWAVSKTSSGTLSEINVQGPYSASSVAFHGQYNNRSTSGGGLTVESNGNYAAETSFNADVASTDETRAGIEFGNTPKLAGTAFFYVTSTGALRVSYGSGGVFSSVELPFQSGGDTTITYKLTETSSSTKEYTVVVTKNAQNIPTSLTATFVQSAGVRVTTNAYTLASVFVPPVR